MSLSIPHFQLTHKPLKSIVLFFLILPIETYFLKTRSHNQTRKHDTQMWRKHFQCDSVQPKGSDWFIWEVWREFTGPSQMNSFISRHRIRFKCVSSDRLWLHFASTLNIQINCYMTAAMFMHCQQISRSYGHIWERSIVKPHKVPRYFSLVEP